MSAPPGPPLRMFSALGVELEFMIVERDTLEPLSIADHVLATEAGGPASHVQRGPMGWSNEFVMHVLEVKNTDPTLPAEQLAPAFQREVRYLNRLLDHYHARLMPTAMHPWMNPAQAQVWRHDNAELYATYARIFDCSGHGWTNLQSMHLNLPFADDDEFARLHAAVRLILPLLPALCASSPVADGRVAPALDYRMQVYAHNADEYPSIAGHIIPEAVCSRREYEQQVLAPMYRDIAPRDPEGRLQHEWLNSRGAIARFDRNAIELRVIDTQENPKVDLAIAAAVTGMIRRLVQSGPPLDQQLAMPTDSLATIFQSCVQQGEQALVENEEYLALLGYADSSCSAAELLRWLLEKAIDDERLPGDAARRLHCLAEHGSLSRRILKALDGDTSRARLARVYRRLCECLDSGQMFLPSAA